MQARDYPRNLIDEHLSDISQKGIQRLQNKRSKQQILPFVTQYEPISAKCQTNFNEKMAHHRDTTTTQRDL